MKNKSRTIIILGLMTSLAPFTIDMYLPAFQAIALEFGTTVSRVSLSLSSYFIGLSIGQLMYGPLLDRFGRKHPVYAGLSLYILATLFCLWSRTTENLVVWRFVQAFGGCAVGVASMAMVRDLFTLKESAKVFSLLILILGSSPLLAPTVGSYLSETFGWSSIFVVLAVFGLLLLLAIRFLLPNSSPPDHVVSLKPRDIISTYAGILRNREFATYAVSGAVAFSGLFVYLAGSPIIFLENLKVSAQAYGVIFGVVAMGMIVASQLNVQLIKRYSNHQILLAALIGQVVTGLVLLIAIGTGHGGLYEIVVAMFCLMFSFGLVNPNAAAMALAPFAKNAGSAAAMMGFLQMALGALASMLVGSLGIKEILPIFGIITSASALALGIYLKGSQGIAKSKLVSSDESLQPVRKSAL